MIVPVKGMHCKSCEMLIEEELKEVKYVDKVEADVHKAQVEIYYEQEPDKNLIDEAIRRAGYSIGRTSDDEKYVFSHDKDSYKDLGVAALALGLVYLVARSLGLFDLNFSNSSGDLTITMVLLVGLTAGVSTCMALVGGLGLGMAAKHNKKHPEATALQKFRPHLFFNLGRVLGFALLGGLLGSIGSTFQLSGSAIGVLTIVIALLMLLMGLQLIGIFPWLNNVKIVLPKALSRTLGFGGHDQEYSHRAAIIMGALTFFLPCGFTQTMQLYAVASGNFVSGAMIMGLFALGTAPGLLGVGGISSMAKGIFAKRFFKFAGLAVIIFSLFNMHNGFNLTGWNLASQPSEQNQTVANDPNVTLENGVQVVHMTETANGYSPNKFSIKKGVPVKWIVDSQAPYSCASVLIMKKFKIQKFLAAGENTIEFTPTEVGQLDFSCSMGMYTGVFNVYDDASATNSSNVSTTNGAAANSNALVATENNVQVLKATYTADNSLQPSDFRVKANQPVRLNIDVKDDGSGCGTAMTIRGLYDNQAQIQAGVPITMEFTPTTPGTYNITCGMGMIRFGSITVE